MALTINDIADCGPEYWGWFANCTRSGAGITGRVLDPETDKWRPFTVNSRELYAAYRAVKTQSCCCAEFMDEDGFSYACSQDADAILQHAVFGEIVYA